MDADGRHGGPPGSTRPLMLRAFGVPISWGELTKRAYREALADNCLGLEERVRISQTRS